jgi:hypothetical protein
MQTHRATTTVNEAAGEVEPVWCGVEIVRCPSCQTALVAGEQCPRGCRVDHRGRRLSPRRGVGRLGAITLESPFEPSGLEATGARWRAAWGARGVRRASGLRRRAGLQRTGFLRRSRRRASTRRRAISEASAKQREKVAGARCLVCGRVPCDPAHLVPRSLGGCDDADCVVPLCRPCHRDFDEHRLCLLPYLEPRYRPELAHALLHLRLVALVERVTGERWRSPGRTGR